jgi:protocatechuate 3,4-dioxygenase beta subunit
MTDPRQRRAFVKSLLALGASHPVLALADAAPDGRAPLTRAQWDALVTRMSNASLTCVRTWDVGEGPFYSESSPERRSLVEGRRGLPLRLGITVAGMTGRSACLPLSGAVVDVWQADGEGLYSNVGPDLQTEDSTGQTFLRGHQVTDETGYVEFDTVVPGWEIVPAPPPATVIRRTSHIHVKVFHEWQIVGTQLYLPDNFLDDLYRNEEPYKSHRLMTTPGVERRYERVRNGEDMNYASDGSRPLRIEKTSSGLYAKAVIGIGGSMGNRGLPSRWR